VAGSARHDVAAASLMMRMLRSFALALLPLLAAMLLAAWLVPPMLDWNRYRDVIADLVSDKLGRAVQIDGPISLSLLPQPMLTAGRISVADAQDGVSLTVAELRLRVALGPLLTRQVDAQELVLRGLDLRIPWPLARTGVQIRAPDWLALLSARIEDGRMAVGGLTLAGINATLGTVPETGSFALAGTAGLGGQSWHMAARLSRAGADGAAGVDLALDGQGRMLGLGASFSGLIAADGQLVGRISGRGPDLSRLLPAPAVAFRADGRLNLSAGLVLADGMDLDIAGSPARGAVSLRLGGEPRLDLSLTASRLDLDAWLPALLRGGVAELAPIPTGIDLSAEAAALAGGTLRGLRGRFEVDAAGVFLREGRMILPGDATLSLDGRFLRGTNDQLPRFAGPFRLDAPALRPAMAWIAGSIPGVLGLVPPGVLRTAKLEGDVSANPQGGLRLELSQLAGQVDGLDVSGKLVMVQGARPSLQARLSLPRLDLDPWLAGATSDLALWSGRARADVALDVALDVQVGEAVLHGQIWHPLVLDIASDATGVRLRRLEASATALRVAARGSVGPDGRLADGRLELQSPSVDVAMPSLLPLVLPFAPRLGSVRLPKWPGLLVVQAAGPMDALALRAVLDFGDLHAETQPVLDVPGQRFNGLFSMRHPGAQRLLDALGVVDAPSWLGDGSLSLLTTISGTPGRVSVDNLDVAAGSLRASGALLLERGAVARLSGRIVAENLPLPSPSMRSRAPLALAGLAGWQASVKVEAAQVLAGLSPVLAQLATEVTLNDGVLSLDGLSARLAGGALAGTMRLQSQADPPQFAAELALTGATIAAPLFLLPIDLAGGVLDATASLTASGHAPAALLSTLSGRLRMSVHDGILSGIDLAAAGPQLQAADLQRALTGGSTAIEQMSATATLQNGAATIDSASFASSAGVGTLAGLLDLAGRSLELRAAMSPAVEQPPEIAVRLSGAWSAPRRALETAQTQLWRATH
jgi:hypothetical protein